MTKYRNYETSVFQDRVENTYKKMLENQTIEYVKEMKSKYSKSKEYNIWTLIEKLDSILDESDPDSDLPQIFHAYQTGESIKKKYLNQDTNIKNLFDQKEWNQLPDKYKNDYNITLKEFYKEIKDWKWFQLIGFIHDLGKVMILEEFGSLPQWSVVGDTFPVGQKLSSNYVFYNKNYHINNDSLLSNTYSNNCGFDQVDFSWGHDEYLASSLERSNTYLPKEAIYLVRYHSFYSWHNCSKSIDCSKRGYIDLASDYDWKMLPLLKAFQKSDLYSKTHILPKIDEIKKEYNKLFNIYIPTKTIYV